MARRHRRQLLKNTYRERSIYKRRMLVCAVMLVMMTGVLVYRYTLLQIIDYDVYKTQSDRNRIQLMPIAPKRGLIFDRNGILLAENIPSYTLTVVRERVKSLDDTLAIIAELIELDDDDIQQFEKRLSRRRHFRSDPEGPAALDAVGFYTFTFKIIFAERLGSILSHGRLPRSIAVVAARLRRHVQQLREVAVVSLP